MRIEPNEYASKRMLRLRPVLYSDSLSRPYNGSGVEGNMLNTKGVLRWVAFLGMLLAGGTGYAQSNHGKEHTQTTGVTEAGGEAPLARLVELQNYTLRI